MSDSRIPTEVELVYEVMPCNALRSAQEPGQTFTHPCAYFRQWGRYHSYDYREDGPPPAPGIVHNTQYVGRATLTPELLSGCRKAPIMAVGINPNLPGWWQGTRNAINPLFDDYKQFAHYFRYRTTSKLQIPRTDYSGYRGNQDDSPLRDFELNVPADASGERTIEVELQAMTMYRNYQSLLDDMATQMGWTEHELSLGEDISYGNMVACPSAKWINRPDSSNPDMPPMTSVQQRGIVSECFHERRYFLRQLFQSLPAVLMVFSQSTADAFIGEMQGRFSEGNPQPGDRIADLLDRTVRLKFGTLPNGTSIEARVIFSPHITGNPGQFGPARAKVLAQLVAEAQAGRIALNPQTKHLKRTAGSCVFCPLLEVGPCDYEDELRSLTPGGPEPVLLGAEGAEPSGNSPLADKRAQAALLEEFMRADGPQAANTFNVGPQLAGADLDNVPAASPVELGWALSGDPARQTDRMAEQSEEPKTEKRVVFFDLWGTLLQPSGRGSVLIPGAEAELARLSGDRLGVLCNASGSSTRRDILRALEQANIAWYFDQVLIVCASDLPTPLPDGRAFLVAAALANVPIESCEFVSSNGALRDAAAVAGMRARAMGAATYRDADGQAMGARPAAGLLGAADTTAAGAFPTLLAGEVDEDTGPTFVLKGRVVTMDEPSRVIDDGRVIIRKGKILSVGTTSQPLPAELDGALQVETGGTIYPGLIDLHNHFAYNVLPLWRVPRRGDGTPFENRSQWPRHREYKPNVTEPLSLMAFFTPTAEAIVRYVEAKAIIGGTTTGQGILGKAGVHTTPRMYHGSMRNVEETNDVRLPEASSMVPNLQGTRPERVAAFRRALNSRKAYFYHLSEGVGTESRSHYLALETNDLIQPSLVGVHALGLDPPDLQTLGDAQAKIVWSPYSNRLLYERTINLQALKNSGTVFGIGCDWTPTGSKNLLFELKVARHFAREQASAYISEDLVRAVTSNAARVVSWGEHLGQLKEGAFADIVVINGSTGDPYDQLIDAREGDVALVVIHGIPRYGDKELFRQVHSAPDREPESLTIGGKEKLLYTFTPDSQINHVTLATARARLEEAMGDLPAFRDRVAGTHNSLLALGMEADDGFRLVLDNEFDEAALSPMAGAPTAELLAAVELPEKIELDGLEVNSGTYWERVEAQPNLPQELKTELRNAYS